MPEYPNDLLLLQASFIRFARLSQDEPLPEFAGLFRPDTARMFAETLILALEDESARAQVRENPLGATQFLSLLVETVDRVMAGEITLPSRDAFAGASPFYPICALIIDFCQKLEVE